MTLYAHLRTCLRKKVLAQKRLSPEKVLDSQAFSMNCFVPSSTISLLEKKKKKQEVADLVYYTLETVQYIYIYI